MTTQAVGIRSLAVSFPRSIRTNQYWLQKFPEWGVQTLQRQARPPRSVEVADDQNGLDLWLQEVTPYLHDPFRGSVNRYVLSADESARTLESRAAQSALDAANLTPEDVDLAIVAALFPETVGPGHAAHLAHDLGLRCPAWNLESTCSSALIALQNAQALVQTGVYRNVLIVVSQMGSHSVHEADTLSWSMGDSAGAFVVGCASPGQGILSTTILSTANTRGAYRHELAIDPHGHPWLQTRTGEDVSILAETAVDFVRDCCQAAVRAADVSLDRIDFFVFNTPTAWYANVCVKALGIAPERTLNLYPQYANIGPVFPVANLYHAVLAEKIRENDLVLVYTNGAGATAAATVMRWGNVALGRVSADSVSPLPLKEPVYLAAQPLSRETSAAGDGGFKAKLMATAPEAQYSILSAYLLDWLANSQQLSPTQLHPQLCLVTLLDSLMAILFRSHIEAVLQVRVPMEQFFGDRTIDHLTQFLLHQLAVSQLIVTESGTPISSNQIEREIMSL
ncbi:MAG: 3-oxoacyl-ACP synthase [Oscillatoriophycideae cyanobacterium NC_groundwater_1537_Pr4_S-0.65um_50_18]|nr:3-oxoacyl-ACP synthase [Oscillatoriophycideae cyanobacterium NC_groundwater_1537_Pr4_S-0.65um_50_18]